MVFVIYQESAWFFEVEVDDEFGFWSFFAAGGGRWWTAFDRPFAIGAGGAEEEPVDFHRRPSTGCEEAEREKAEQTLSKPLWLILSKEKVH